MASPPKDFKFNLDMSRVSALDIRPSASTTSEQRDIGALRKAYEGYSDFDGLDDWQLVVDDRLGSLVCELDEVDEDDEDVTRGDYLGDVYNLLDLIRDFSQGNLPTWSAEVLRWLTHYAHCEESPGGSPLETDHGLIPLTGAITIGDMSLPGLDAIYQNGEKIWSREEGTPPLDAIDWSDVERNEAPPVTLADVARTNTIERRLKEQKWQSEEIPNEPMLRWIQHDNVLVDDSTNDTDLKFPLAHIEEAIDRFEGAFPKTVHEAPVRKGVGDGNLVTMVRVARYVPATDMFTLWSLGLLDGRLEVTYSHQFSGRYVYSTNRPVDVPDLVDRLSHALLHRGSRLEKEQGVEGSMTYHQGREQRVEWYGGFTCSVDDLSLLIAEYNRSGETWGASRIVANLTEGQEDDSATPSMFTRISTYTFGLRDEQLVLCGHNAYHVDLTNIDGCDFLPAPVQAHARFLRKARDFGLAYCTVEEADSMIQTEPGKFQDSNDDRLDALMRAPCTFLDGMSWRGEEPEPEEKPDFAAITRALATGG